MSKITPMLQPSHNQEPIIFAPVKPVNFYAFFEKGSLVNTADLIKQTWKIFKHNWKKYIFLLLWLYAPLVVFGLLIGIVVITLLIVSPAILSSAAKFLITDLPFLPSGIWLILSIAILAAIIFYLAYLIFSFVVSFALILHTHQIDQDLSVKELFKQSYKKVYGGIWVQILAGLIILAGYLLFIVPGIILSIKYSLALYAYLIEGKKGRSALKRSAELTNGYCWSILRRYLIWFYLIIGRMLVIMFIPGLNFFANFITIILTPLGVIYSYNIYRNLKNLKDSGRLADNYKFKDKFLTFLLVGGILIFIIIVCGFMALGVYLGKTEKNYKNNPKTNYYKDNWNYDDWNQDENNLDYNEEDWIADESLPDDEAY